MFLPRQMMMHPMAMMPMRQMPLMEHASGAFPVPQAMSADRLPAAVKEAIMRPLQGPPKPAVTLAVMNAAQESMIAPDLPWKADV